MNVVVTGVLFTACVFGFVEYPEAARILAIVPTPSYSHQAPFRPLWRSLISHGHEVVLVSSNPMSNVNSTKLTQINVQGSYKSLRKINFIQKRYEFVTWLDLMEAELLSVFQNFLETVYEHPEMRKMYAPDSNVTFDVVLAEYLFTPGIFALAHRFNAPLIGLNTLELTILNQYILGWPILPSHPSTWEMEKLAGLNLPFWRRLKNFIICWRAVYRERQDYIYGQQRLVERYLGSDIPSIEEIAKNASLFFISQTPTMAFARPKPPNIISFDSSYNIEEAAPLSNELKDFIESTANGFIYFSLGSNAMSSDLPKECIRIFCDVFAKLPYKIVWKYEKEWPGKPENIYAAPWLPQQSILAHPNIKLYIYQGGLQSSEEAIRHAVPLVGIPILGDQEHNLNKLVSIGVARKLDLASLTERDVEDAIVDVLTDKGYKNRMIQLKNVSEDKPYDQIENLVWWTEYVIRHKGAPHLRTTIVDEPWYQRYDVDIVAFLAIVIFVISVCALILIYEFIIIMLRHCISPPISWKQKTC